jgi:hypothetical protein
MSPLARQVDETERRKLFRRDIARFELAKARRLLSEGRADRAAVALLRARLWRARSPGSR